MVDTKKSKYVPIASLPLEVAVAKSCISEQPVAQLVSVSASQIKSEGQLPSESVLIETPIHRDTEIPVVSDLSDSADLTKIQERWTYILETARAFNYSLEALLRSVKIAKCDEKIVVIEVPYSFHQRQLEVPKSRDMLESILSDILSRPIRISTTLAKRTVKREDIANVEVAADDELVRLASEIFSSETAN